MAETQADKPQTLAEQYSLEKQEKPDVVKVVEHVPSTETVTVKADEPPAAEEESSVVTPASEETSEVTPTATSEEVTETTAATEESSETVPEVSSETVPEVSSETVPEVSSDSTENSGDQEAEIKIETAPADFRFPTTNQTRHCFTRYVEYHRCIAAKGEEAPECDKFKKYYRSLCPGEWVERWNEQRENGTFPGPL